MMWVKWCWLGRSWKKAKRKLRWHLLTHPLSGTGERWVCPGLSYLEYQMLTLQSCTAVGCKHSSLLLEPVHNCISIVAKYLECLLTPFWCLASIVGTFEGWQCARVVAGLDEYAWKITTCCFTEVNIYMIWGVQKKKKNCLRIFDKVFGFGMYLGNPFILALNGWQGQSLYLSVFLPSPKGRKWNAVLKWLLVI